MRESRVVEESLALGGRVWWAMFFENNFGLADRMWVIFMRTRGIEP